MSGEDQALSRVVRHELIMPGDMHLAIPPDSTGGLLLEGLIEREIDRDAIRGILHAVDPFAADAHHAYEQGRLPGRVGKGDWPERPVNSPLPVFAGGGEEVDVPVSGPVPVCVQGKEDRNSGARAKQNNRLFDGALDVLPSLGVARVVEPLCGPGIVGLRLHEDLLDLEELAASPAQEVDGSRGHRRVFSAALWCQVLWAVGVVVCDPLFPPIRAIDDGQRFLPNVGLQEATRMDKCRPI